MCLSLYPFFHLLVFKESNRDSLELWSVFGSSYSNFFLVIQQFVCLSVNPSDETTSRKSREVWKEEQFFANGMERETQTPMNNLSRDCHIISKNLICNLSWKRNAVGVRKKVMLCIFINSSCYVLTFIFLCYLKAKSWWER